MASPSPLTLFLLILAPPLLLLNVEAQSPAAPAPAPSLLNLTAILEKGGQFTTLMRLLSSTQVGIQIVNQVNNSDQGLTLLAPTDNAFNNLKPGALNGLSPQQQVALLLYHVLPKFYSIDMFDTISNPVRTQATGNDGGLYTLNFTTSANQVNVSTGIVSTQINNALRSKFPLAVYQLDAVLLPLDLFGAKPPASAPPLSSPSAKPSPPSSPSSAGPSGLANSNSTNAGCMGRNVKWSFVAGATGLMMLGTLF